MNTDYIVSYFRQFGPEALQALQSPQSNPQLAALIIGLAVAVLLVILMILMLAFTPSRRRVRKVVRYWVPEGVEPPPAVVEAASPEQTPAAPAKPKRERRKLPAPIAFLVGPALIPLLVFGAIAGTYALTSTDEYCTLTCHSTQPTVRHAEKVAHASCVSCHENALPGGVISNTSDRLRMVAVQVSGGDKQPAAVVDSQACLRCHESIQTSVTVNDAEKIRMKHAEPLASGMTCAQCHGGVGHLQERQPVPMSRCLSCHDGKAASAECATCHTTNVETEGAATATQTAKPTGRLEYPITEFTRKDCGGCHDQVQECDSCHGIRMPHDQRFISGYHAKPAAFEKKAACWRCHDEGEDCGKCHRVPFATGHYANWKAAHSDSPADAVCICHTGNNKDRSVSMCSYCHDTAPK